MTLKIKNISGDTLMLHTKEFAVDELFTVSELDCYCWSKNDAVILAVTEGKIQIYNNDTPIESAASQLQFLMGFAPVNINLLKAFMNDV